MASIVSVAGAAFLLLAIVHAAGVVKGQPMNCTQQLAGLSLCAPFAVPGGGAPTPPCCSALQALAHDCICTTTGIVSTLPSQCALPPVACPARE